MHLTMFQYMSFAQVWSFPLVNLEFGAVNTSLAFYPGNWFGENNFKFWGNLSRIYVTLRPIHKIDKLENDYFLWRLWQKMNEINIEEEELRVDDKVLWKSDSTGLAHAQLWGKRWWSLNWTNFDLGINKYSASLSSSWSRNIVIMLLPRRAGISNKETVVSATILFWTLSVTER